MKYWMAFSVAALAVGCSTQKARAPAREPVGTTTVTTTSALSVQPSQRSRAEPDTGNAALTRRIRARLRADPALAHVRLDAIHIHEVDDGHVTIDGYVPTMADATEIEGIVRSSDGVVAVANELRRYGDVP